MEVWKDVVGYEGLYKVSNMGNVFSIKKSRNLSQDKTHGYMRVLLSRNGKRYHKLVHRLVAEAFIPNPNMQDEINHKDENPKNNKVENLEWCSHKYNMNYGTRTQRASAAQKGKGKIIMQYTRDGEFIRKWNSTMDIQRELNIHHTHISRCCRGKRPSAGGFVWRYENKAQ